jgi:hypothetical protein
LAGQQVVGEANRQTISMYQTAGIIGEMATYRHGSFLLRKLAA